MSASSTQTSAPAPTDPSGRTSPAPPSTTAVPVETRSPSARTDLNRRWRRWRWPLLLAVLAVGSVMVASLASVQSSGPALDPGSTAPDGSAALARILRAHDVRIVPTHSASEAADELDWALDGDADDVALVVVSPELLSSEDLGILRSYRADLVLVAPDQVTLDALAPTVQTVGETSAAPADPQCTDPDAVAAGRTTGGGFVYSGNGVDGSASSSGENDTPTVCYQDEDGGGSLVLTHQDERRVAVLGQAKVLTNQHLAEEGNAALALRLLGRHHELVWLGPRIDRVSDSASGDGGSSVGGAGRLLPRATWWIMLQLLLASVVAMLWRGRRLGPLVAEPLPVVVRAAEAQLGRARLYHQARARGRAAATLRTATARRLARQLALPPDARPEDLVTVLTARTGLPAQQVTHVLLGPVPADDPALVRLADDLDVLERALTPSSPTQSTPKEPRS